MTDYYGSVIITWPETKDGLPLPGYAIRIEDARTGKQLTNVLRCTIDVVLNDLIVAVLTMLTDADGAPSEKPVPDGNGGFRSAVFRWLVAEMRVAT